jgi:hypothetical protein
VAANELCGIRANADCYGLRSRFLDGSELIGRPMDSYISEFSYGYALTSEVIARFSLKPVGAPVFPTQSAEGKTGGGWDVKLPGVPVYLQFKRAARMIRRSAGEAHLFKNLPFFRMYLHRRDQSDQHQLLLDLESKGNIVAYAAPGFSEGDELNEAYCADLVAERSIFVRPGTIGPLPDDSRHWIAFQTTPPVAFRCSQPEAVEFVLPDALFRPPAAAEANRRRQGPRPQSYAAVAEELLEIYQGRRSRRIEQERVERVRRVRERRDAPDFAQLVARTLFQAELLVLPA